MILQSQLTLKFISVSTALGREQTRTHRTVFTDKLPTLFSTGIWQDLQPDGFANDFCKVLKSEATVTHDCHV